MVRNLTARLQASRQQAPMKPVTRPTAFGAGVDQTLQFVELDDGSPLRQEPTGLEFALQESDLTLTVAPNAILAAAKRAFPMKRVELLRIEVKARDRVSIARLARRIRVGRQAAARPIANLFGESGADQELDFRGEFAVFAQIG